MDIRILDEQDRKEIDKEIDSHIDSKIYKDEVHGMKFNSKGKLEVYNGKEWIELKGGGLPVNIARNVNVYGLGDKMVELRWEDPDDVVVDGEIVAKWKSTKIVRKQGSMPKNDEDGVLVGQSSIRNQYKDKSFIDTQGLINGTHYYYGIFPESEDEIVTVSEESIVKATPVEMYGFEIDESNLNPATAVTYIGSNASYTPMKVSDYGSWEKLVKDISTPVLLKSGKVQYELQYDDFTKKKDGSNSILTGEDGDVMIRFKHLWVKEEKVSSTKRRVWLSDKAFEGATSYSQYVYKTGYDQLSWGVLITLQHLYLLLYKDRNSQTALGKGYVDASDFAKTGDTNTKPYFFGETTGKQQMKFCGIESFWGNKLNWVAGIEFDRDGEVWFGAYFIAQLSGYVRGYIKSTIGGAGGYLVKSGDGSSTTGYCDYGLLRYDSYSGSAKFGGSRSNPTSAGVFCVEVDTNDSHTGSRLCFVDDDYFYVGAYTGYVEGTKLRSISGKIPTGSKTIGEFRTYAQNNN